MTTKTVGQTLATIIESLRVDERLESMTDAELADLLSAHVLPTFEADDPRATLVMHVAERLRREVDQ